MTAPSEVVRVVLAYPLMVGGEVIDHVDIRRPSGDEIADLAAQLGAGLAPEAPFFSIAAEVRALLDFEDTMNIAEAVASLLPPWLSTMTAERAALFAAQTSNRIQ